MAGLAAKGICGTKLANWRDHSPARLLNNYPLIRFSLLIPLWINAIHLVLPRFILRFARSVTGSKETRRNRRVESPSSFSIRSDTKSSLLVFDVFIVEYNVEDRKDARKREGRREREREETMENGRKEDEVREAEKRPRTGMHGSQICISMASNINYT